MSVVSRLAITSVRVPTDTPDTCWNKLLLPSTQIERPFTKIESASISSEADSVSVDASSKFVESASGGTAFDAIFVEFNAGAATSNSVGRTSNVGGKTSNSVGKTSNVFSKNAKLFLCAQRMRSHKLFFSEASPANLEVNFHVWDTEAVYGCLLGLTFQKMLKNLLFHEICLNFVRLF